MELWMSILQLKLYWDKKYVSIGMVLHLTQNILGLINMVRNGQKSLIW